MDRAGSIYRAKYDNNEGLLGSEKEAFLTSLGLVGEPPMSYSVDGFLSLLQTHGPVWVTTDEDPTERFSVHARIVTGMFGDGSVERTYLRIVDPADGGRHEESFRLFMQKYEEVAIGDTEAGQPLRVQVVHF